MTTTVGQKIKLSIIFIVMNIVWAIDFFLGNLRLFFVSFGRLFLYLILVTSFFTGFYLEAKIGAFTNVPQILNPTEDTLGVATTNIDYPILVENIEIPEISSKAVYIRDVINDKDLLRINYDEKLAPASTTKLMTAIVALDIYDTDEILTIPTFCTEIDAQKSGFLAGDRYKVSELIQSLLINSSADAACTLSLGRLTYTEFVSEMNDKAREIGLVDTSFTNPVGLDGENDDHISTAKDLYTLAIYARKIPEIKNVVGVKETYVTSESGESTNIFNTNDLLWTIPGSVGIKTGKTEAAGEVLIYEYNYDSKNIIIVVMGSSDRFGDTSKLLNWTLNSYAWEDF